jgi:hypothetical protein
MMCRSLVVSLGLVCLVLWPGWAQSQSDQVREIRDQIQALQDKLKMLENGESTSATRQRTTQLGRTRVREEEPEIVVQIYDLSDLLAVVSPYPAMVTSDLGPFDTPLFPGAPVSISGASAPFVMSVVPGGASGMGGMGGMGGGFMSVRSKTSKPGTPSAEKTAPEPAPQPGAMLYRSPKPGPAGMSGGRISVDELIDAITTTIEPTQWETVGGPGSIAPLGNTLLISTSPSIHEQITRLFDNFRKRWGTLRTVSVQAHWLWLTEAQVASLLAEGPKGTERPPFGLVNDAAWDSLMKDLRQAGDKQPTGYHAVFTCYNGQTVHAVSGTQRRMLEGIVPVVGEQVGYQPVMGTLQEGAALQVTPMVTTGNKLVVMDVHSRVVLAREQPKRPAIDVEIAAGGKSPVRDVLAAIDRPHLANLHIETTLRIPVDRRMLVGGMTFEAQPKTGESALYLFIKPVVQELRDDATARPEATPPAEKPAPKPAKP